MRSPSRAPFHGLAFLTLFAAFHSIRGPVFAQEDYGYRLGTQVPGGYAYRPAGVPIYAHTLDPTVHRWYLPQIFFREYGRRQWEYTNYASRRFNRPVNASLPGEDYYDFYGDYVTRGWLVYDWRQSQPRIAESSSITQTTRYRDWFQRLVISSDRKGDFALSFMVGDEIATTLTPMTFRKAGFNGVVTSLSTGRLQATGVFSRVSDPVFFGTARFQQMTNFGGGRLEADVSDALTLGFTFVNSHNNRGGLDSFEGNPFRGFLSSEQTAQRPNFIVLQLTDDSPEDNEGGAVLVSHDVEFRTRVPVESLVGDSVVTVFRDTVVLGRNIGFGPSIEGGRLRQGLRRADGADKIIMRYYLGPTPDLPEEEQLLTLQPLLEKALLLDMAGSEQVVADIEEVRFRLVLANDYKVEMSSDHQTDRDGVPRFRLVTRADGNTKDLVNQREVVFSYGLPTATQIYGFTAELRDFHGLDVYGEVNVNTEYRKYPTPDRTSRSAVSGIRGDRNSLGFMLNASWKRGPWSVLGEAFGMEDGYTTSVLPMDRSGRPDFSPENTHLLYDFVDDNDDHDRHPDQRRFGQGALVPIRGSRLTASIDERGVADPEVFPGYDENGDFISDFNQNNNPERPNFFPDYDEPFVRYRSDRPEFLFGIDLNNNGWAEPFENDDEPDYPYKRDHWGYNLFGSVQAGPEGKLTVGRLRQDRRKSDEQNHTDYVLASFVSRDSRKGRIRVYEMLKRAEDTIADNLVQWIVPESTTGDPSASSGRLQAVPDLLAAEDTWINTLYADLQFGTSRVWSTFHRFKWETWRQRDTEVTYQIDAEGNLVLDAVGDPVVLFDPLGPEGRNGRQTSGFVGMINKAEYVHLWRSLLLNPRFKSELLRVTPFSRSVDKRRSWDGILFLQAEIPVFQSSRIRLGWEQRFFTDLRGDEEEVQPGRRTGDFRGTALAAQLTNVSDYLGYALTTQVGMRVDRRSFEISEDENDISTSGLVFLTMFTSLRE